MFHTALNKMDKLTNDGIVYMLLMALFWMHAVTLCILCIDIWSREWHLWYTFAVHDFTHWIK